MSRPPINDVPLLVQGGDLVLRRDAALPHFCVHCGDDAAEFFSLSLPDRSRGGLRAELAFALCPAHVTRARRMRNVGILLGLAGVAMVILCLPASNVRSLPWLGVAMGFGSIPMLLSAFFVAGQGAPALEIVAATATQVVVRGAGRGFLDRASTERPWVPSSEAGQTMTMDRASRATRPGELACSTARLLALQPELRDEAAWAPFRRSHIRCACTEHHARAWWIAYCADHMRHGALEVAVVVSTEPLVIAAYSQGLDAVVLLRFREEIDAMRGLPLGARLMTVNTYMAAPDCPRAPDIDLGPRARPVWSNFAPMIAEFYCDDEAALSGARSRIGEREWGRAEELGRAALARARPPFRDGAAVRAHEAGSWV